jgi:hypothetical protein
MRDDLVLFSARGVDVLDGSFVEGRLDIVARISLAVARSACGEHRAVVSGFRP